MPEDVEPKVGLWLLIILVLLVFAFALIYFSRGNGQLAEYDQALINNRPPAARQPRTYTVFYNTGVFSPTNLRVHVGDTVRFQNDGNKPTRVVSDENNGVPELPGFDSLNIIQPNGSFSFTFTKAGTFGYHDALDKGTRGTVIVRP